MKTITTRIGEVEIPEQAAITFQQGLPGFETLKGFALLPLQEGAPFWLLQSLEDTNISFYVCNPFDFQPTYEWNLPASVQQELEIEDASEVEIWSILTVSEVLTESTINLLAPIIVNRVKGLGKQHILHDTGYSAKHPLMSPLHRNSESAE